MQGIVLWGGRERFFVEQTVHTRLVSANARMPILTGLFGAGTMADAAFFLGLVVAGGCAYLIARTRRGYEMRAVGQSRAGGPGGGHLRLGRVVVSTMALAGWPGRARRIGHRARIQGLLTRKRPPDRAPASWGSRWPSLAKNNPLLILPAALLFGTLAQGGLAANSVVPKEIIEVIQAVIILAVAWRGLPSKGQT